MERIKAVAQALNDYGKPAWLWKWIKWFYTFIFISVKIIRFIMWNKLKVFTFIFIPVKINLPLPSRRRWFSFHSFGGIFWRFEQKVTFKRNQVLWETENFCLKKFIWLQKTVHVCSSRARIAWYLLPAKSSPCQLLL